MRLIRLSFFGWKYKVAATLIISGVMIPVVSIILPNNASATSLTVVSDVSETEETKTGSTSFSATDTSIASGSLPAGTYFVSWGAAYAANSGTRLAFIRLVRGTTEIAYIGSEGNASTWTSNGRSGAGYWLGTLSGSEALTIEYAIDNSSATAYVDSKFIHAVRLDDRLTADIDYFTSGSQESGADEQSNTSTGSWTTIKSLSKTFHASESQDYLVVGSMEISPDSTSNDCMAQMVIDGTGHTIMTQEGEDTADQYGYSIANVATIGSGSKTIALQGRSVGSATCDYLRSRIYVFRANVFDQVSENESLTESTLASSTWTNKTSLTYTPNQSEDVLVLTSQLVGTSSAASPVVTRINNSTDTVAYFDDTGYNPNNTSVDYVTASSTAKLNISTAKALAGQYHRDAGTGTVKIKDARLIGWSMTINKEFLASQSMYRFYHNQDSATTFVKTWGGSTDDYMAAVAQTPDGGYITAGYTDSYDTASGDIMIIKYDSSGNITWDTVWGGSGYEFSRSVVQVTDGGYVVAGYTSSYGAGGYDMFIAKFTSSGSHSWSRVWGGSNDEIGVRVAATADGGIGVVGHTLSYGSGSYDAFLVRYDSSGTLQWDTIWGGSGTENGRFVTYTSDGGFAIAGSTASFGSGGTDVFLAKFDSGGTLSWDRVWGGSGSDVAISVTQTQDGGFALAGYTTSYSFGQTDILILKYDYAGNLTWNTTWGDTLYEYAEWIKQTTDGGFILTGYTDSFGVGNDDAVLIRLNASGSVLWAKTLGSSGGDEYAYTVNQTADGGFIQAGYTTGFGSGGIDGFIAKYSSNGTIDGCSSSNCLTANLSSANPSANTSDPSATTSSPSPSTGNPSPTTSSPSASTTTVVTTGVVGAVDVGMPLNGVAQDTPTTVVAQQNFRLRAGLHIDATSLPATSNYNFKLQYAARGVDGVCDTSFTNESYSDVTSGTTIAYANNTSAADGDDMIANAADPTHSTDDVVVQEYNEANNTTAINTVPAGDDGLWDFALNAGSAAAGNTYCFRIVNSDNSALNSYSVIPQITVLDGTLSASCDTGFILVPGNATFSTNDFCMSKYEIKNSGSSTPVSTAALKPWDMISRDSAVTTAASVCAGCHLMTEAERLTVAHDVVGVGSNWSSGAVNSGTLFRGHTDSSPNTALAAADDTIPYAGTGQTSGEQRRTFILSNGQVIWDMAGNVMEMTEVEQEEDIPGNPSEGETWREWNAVTDTGNLSPNPFPSYSPISGSSGWTSSINIGRIFSSTDYLTERVMRNGGHWTNGSNAGIFSSAINTSTTETFVTTGFRVAYTLSTSPTLDQRLRGGQAIVNGVETPLEW